jgi:hypothetical protein
MSLTDSSSASVLPWVVGAFVGNGAGWLADWLINTGALVSAYSICTYNVLQCHVWSFNSFACSCSCGVAMHAICCFAQGSIKHVTALRLGSETSAGTPTPMHASL